MNNMMHESYDQGPGQTGMLDEYGRMKHIHHPGVGEKEYQGFVFYEQGEPQWWYYYWRVQCPECHGKGYKTLGNRPVLRCEHCGSRGSIHVGQATRMDIEPHGWGFQMQDSLSHHESYVATTRIYFTHTMVGSGIWSGGRGRRGGKSSATESFRVMIEKAEKMHGEMTLERATVLRDEFMARFFGER